MHIFHFVPAHYTAHSSNYRSLWCTHAGQSIPFAVLPRALGAGHGRLTKDWSPIMLSFPCKICLRQF